MPEKRVRIVLCSYQNLSMQEFKQSSFSSTYANGEVKRQGKRAKVGRSERESLARG